uniref:Uncharacterized protein n=1 Tax=Caenorhabditis japonica TaxID=281687 RepID=A0A8R1HJK7_CAEJA
MAVDIRAIREKLTVVNVTSLTSESINEFEHDVDEYVHLLERQLEVEMEKKMELGNRLGVVQSLVTELWDRVDKARRRESDISYRVTAWAQHLAEKMNEQQLKDLKADCDREEELVKYWNSKSSDIEKVVDGLKEQRKSLSERLDEEKRMEQEQKKMLEELENLLKKAECAAKKRKVQIDVNSNFIASLSDLTEESN